MNLTLSQMRMPRFVMYHLNSPDQAHSAVWLSQDGYLEPPKMAVRLQTQLRSYGYQGSKEDFEDLLIEAKHDSFPDWTDEELTYHPDEAKQYCNLVRSRISLGLPDHFILGKLANIRKHTTRA